MRVLEPEVLMLAVCISMFCVILIIFNLQLYIRRQRTLLSLTVNGASFLSLVFLSGLLIQTSILDLSIIHGDIYSSIQRILGSMALITWVSALIIFVMKPHSRFRLPPDLDLIFKHIDERLMVFDTEGDLFYVNRLIYAKEAWCQQMNQLKTLAHWLPSSFDLQTPNTWFPFEKEIKLSQDYTNFLAVVTPINSRHHTIGLSILFYDISQEKELIYTIETQNLSLSTANEKLKAYVEVAKQYETEKMLQQLMSQLQIDLISHLNQSMNRLEALSQQEKPTKEALQDMAQDIREIYQQVRVCVHELAQVKGKNYEDNNTACR